MIQDIAPHRFHNEYRPGSVPDPKSHVLCFDGKKILIKLQKEEAQENEVVYPLYSMLPEGLDMIYAFSVDDTEYFLCPHNVIPAMEGYEYIDVMKIRGFADNV
mgnify:FL=1